MGLMVYIYPTETGLPRRIHIAICIQILTFCARTKFSDLLIDFFTLTLTFTLILYNIIKFSDLLIDFFTLTLTFTLILYNITQFSDLLIDFFTLTVRYKVFLFTQRFLHFDTEFLID